LTLTQQKVTYFIDDYTTTKQHCFDNALLLNTPRHMQMHGPMCFPVKVIKVEPLSCKSWDQLSPSPSLNCSFVDFGIIDQWKAHVFLEVKCLPSHYNDNEENHCVLEKVDTVEEKLSTRV
jgi:hypothetical protein